MSLEIQKEVLCDDDIVRIEYRNQGIKKVLNAYLRIVKSEDSAPEIIKSIFTDSEAFLYLSNNVSIACFYVNMNVDFYAKTIFTKKSGYFPSYKKAKKFIQDNI